jgi:prepilin-type N-terminal cleavage/methylation domain-containing protein
MLPPRLTRRGFTLIELLVVIAIIGSLLGLTSLSFRPSRGSEIRQAAQSLASLLLTTQSRALGNEAGAALWILSSGSAAGIYDADVRADLIGDVSEVLHVTASGTATIESTLPPSDLAGVFRARLIARASDSAAPSPWFATDAGDPLELDLWFSGSQTQNNTIWPPRFYTHAADPQCRVHCSTRPAKSGLLYAWPKLAKVDTRWSGFSNEAAAGTDIGIVFDKFGKPDLVFFGEDNWRPMNGPLFLLIAFRPDVEDSSAPTTKPLTNEDSIWVALHPETGRITVSWNNPSTDLAQAREYSRAGLGLAR